MPNEKLTPEGEVIAAYGAAMVAAFQVLLNCLEENEAVQPGQFPAALRNLHGDGQEQTRWRERHDACGAP
jgi:hypothetical protein